MNEMHLGHGFRLPLEVATQTLLVVGKRGSGKSSTATRLAEQLIDARVPIAVLDPVDVWWGLKAGADGSREGGKEVYIFGGPHADLPLEPGAGELMADVLVDNRISAVMVLREFSNREKAKFVAPFADRLFRRNREVLHLFAEEAHELMPQKSYFEGEEQMLGYMVRLLKLGRNSGVGMTAVTQRPASLNKDATTQAEILIAHRLIGPQDIVAIEGWIKHHHQEALKQQVLSTLPELKTGETWVWAPDFPEEKPVGLQRVRILMPVTFDSRKTPKPGERRTEPKQLAAVDLEKLRVKMASTIERAKQSDPRVLQAEVARLRAELARKPQVEVATPVRVEVPVLKPEDMEKLERLGATVRAAAHDFQGIIGQAVDGLTNRAEFVAQAARDVVAAIGAVKSTVNGARSAAAVRPLQPILQMRNVAVNRRTSTLVKTEPVTGQKFGKGERRMLAAIAQHPEGSSRERLTVLTGYKRSSRDTYIQRLQTMGYAAVEGNLIVATPDGVGALGDDYRPLPTGQALQDHWMQRLPEGERRILEILIGAYPEAVDRDALSEATGYKRSSRDTYLQRLRARGLVKEVGRGTVEASDMLFEFEVVHR